jgi:predicted ester cyclase
MANRKYSVLILTDSRGRGLEELLYTHLKEKPEIEFQVRVYPGATLELIQSKIARLRRHYDLKIVIAGICNLTQKERESKLKLLTYRECSSKLEATKGTLGKLIAEDQFVSTITPASLDAYAKHFNKDRRQLPDQATEQKKLLEDLDSINSYIKDLSRTKEGLVINLAKQVFKSSRKKRGKSHKTIYRFEDKDLPDGVHLSNNLKKVWAKIIATAINKSFDLQSKHIPNRPESSEEEIQEDTGNFKRVKRRKTHSRAAHHKLRSVVQIHSTSSFS